MANNMQKRPIALTSRSLLINFKDAYFQAPRIIPIKVNDTTI